MRRLISKTAKKGILNRTCTVIIQAAVCLISILFCTTIALNPADTAAATKGYLLDKTIKWADGVSEQVQIDSERYFIIDGIKKKMIGIVLSTEGLPYNLNANGGEEFYLPRNLAFLDKELTYLESIEIRVISVDLHYIRWFTPNNSIKEEEAGYKALLDLLYKHKMLVIPQTNAKWMPNFNNLQNPDFSWDVEGRDMDSWGSYLKRWTAIVGRYPNIVAVSADNELDYLLKAQDISWDPNFKDQNYGAQEVTNYLNYSSGILRKLNVPIIHKLMANNLWRTDIKEASIRATDFPAFDCYATSAPDMDIRLKNLAYWLKKTNLPTTGWWAMELNNGWPNGDLDKFNTGYIDSVFNNGATLATLFPSSGWGEASFFNDDGSPVTKMTEIAAALPRLQDTGARIIASRR